MEFLGYYPGAIGEVTRLHAVYYAENWGFDLSFEAQVARELSEFLTRLDPARDLFLAAREDGRLAGAVAMDGGVSPDEGVRLRWLIVDPAFHGRGLGREIVGRALDFIRRAGHRRAFLWTFRGLEAARALYEDAGFQMDFEEGRPKWGGTVYEQRYVLEL